jgi:hypothetical protein
MSAARIASLVLIVLAAGCAGIERTPPREPPQAVAPQQETIAAKAAAPTVPPSARPSAAKIEPPSAKAPASTPATPAPAPQPAKKEAPAPVAKKPDAPPPLDLASLETRLKETKAIGVMTKIALKNQIDDLLSQIRAFHQGRLNPTLAELRKSFDLVVLKALSLLQDSDSSLASAIVTSREAIWGVLADPIKFANFAML